MTELNDLNELGDSLLQQARDSHARRAGRTVYGGSDHTLRQTLIALAEGAELSEHENPGEATVQVLSGTVRLHGTTGEGEAGVEERAAAGQLVTVPADRHSLTAMTDAVVLLTVGEHRR